MLQAHPFKSGLRRFRGAAFSVSTLRQHPTDFRIAMKGRDRLPPKIAEAHLSNESACLSFAYDPESEPEELPMADVAQKPQPGFFPRERSSPDVANNRRIAPHGRTVFEIAERRQAKRQPLGIEFA